MNLEAEYNLKKLKERFQEIEDTLLGLKTPVTKLVCNDKGMLTDEKVQELAERVIWRECNLYGKNIGILGTKKRYYELLFYLILRAYDPGEKIQNFSDFLDVAEQLANGYKCYEELVLHDAGILPGRFHFHETIYESCMILTGHSISDEFGKEELEDMKQDFERKQEIWEKKNKELNNVFYPSQEDAESVWDKYKDYGEEGIDSYENALDNEYYYKFGSYILDELSEKYYESFDEYGDNMSKEPEMTEEERKKPGERGKEIAKKQERLEKARRKKWAATFDKPEKYLEAYREFSELNFLVDVMSGEQNLKSILLDILEEKGFNKSDDDDRIKIIYSELNRILRIARSRF